MSEITGGRGDAQKTPFQADLTIRPRTYASDLFECAAIKFSAGNMIYSGFLLLQTGLNFGAIAASALHTALTVFTTKKQLDATYTGRNFHAPYKVQATGNFLAAAFIAASGIYSYCTNRADEPAPAANTRVEVLYETTEAQRENGQLWSRMIFPALTFGAWGMAHFFYGASVARRKNLLKQGRHDNEVAADPQIRKAVRRCEIAAGVADITAIFKDKSVNEAVQTLSHPLDWHHLNSLTGLPFFMLGFCQSVSGGEKTPVGRVINSLYRNIDSALPDKLRGPFHLSNQNITPLHCYAAGYTGTAAVTTISAIADPVQWVFAAASAVWGIGYHDMTRESTRTPESADEYAARREAGPVVQPL